MASQNRKSRAVHSAAQNVTAPPSVNRLIETHRIDPRDNEGKCQVSVNLAESPIVWLVRRGLLTPAQFAAAEALRGDFMRAGLLPSTTMRWDAAPISRTARGAPPAADPTTARIAARRRFDGATAAAGPGLSDILWRVACMGEGLDTAERAMSWPARSAKLVLGLALDRVAGFYGIA